MAMGTGGHSAADLSRYLEGLRFPVSRLEMIRHARQHHADPEMIERMEKMADQQYDSLDEVADSYRQVH